MQVEGAMEPQAGPLERVSILGHVMSWAKRCSQRFRRPDGLQALDADEVNRIARDFGLSTSDLLTLAGSGSHVRELLTQRLAGMGLSEEILKKKHFSEFGDLNRVCANCTSTKRCASDFQNGRSGHSGYCPNTDTLEALRAAGDANNEPDKAAPKS
ncbi:hypothetical protein CSIRO_1900 [Bradyrhizobiaceae bacterium SG-6C]|nr:hypothetical protein CSIRO_1900 [Bradyrhizobiaceae bacterium SG-6C]